MGVRFGGMEKLGSILMPHPHYMERLRFTFVQIKFKIFEYFAHIFDFSKKKNTSLASWGKISTLCLTPE